MPPRPPSPVDTLRSYLLHPGYVVAEVPDPPGSAVHALRLALGTPTANLPVEIALLGSSGLGPLPPGTGLGIIRRALASLVRENFPFTTHFSSLQFFPSTSIAYLVPESRLPFERLHQALRRHQLPCLPSPFPYQPHCTIRLGGLLSSSDRHAVLRRDFPRDPFSISTLALYELDPETRICNRLLQVHLNPGPPPSPPPLAGS